VVGVWVGNNDYTSMDNIAGSLGAAPIWRNLMETFLEQSPLEPFIKPAGIVKEASCNPLPIASFSATFEYFIKSTEPICGKPTNTPSPTSKEKPTQAPKQNDPTSQPEPTKTPTPSNGASPTTQQSPVNPTIEQPTPTTGLAVPTINPGI
jgi:membrane peptidoglycan carboxypeptidase